MTTQTAITLTPDQAAECDAIQWKIYRMGVMLDRRIKEYNDVAEVHCVRIAKALSDLNAAISEASEFRATLGEHEPYRPIGLTVPHPIAMDEDGYDAVYYDLDELPRGE